MYSVDDLTKAEQELGNIILAWEKYANNYNPSRDTERYYENEIKKAFQKVIKIENFLKS